MSQELIQILKARKAEFLPVVPFNPSKDKIKAMDLSAGNTIITADISNDIALFTSCINQLLKTNGARYGIGGYDEHRSVYSASRVFDGDKITSARRLHLGTDIWGKPYTAVQSPLPGIVHSFAFNNQKGDYGATIILSHRLGDVSFHTLYGHLSLNSISDIEEGKRMEAGEIFAEFGIPSENGQWPPHLHFQLIYDLGEWKGDYPGVCALEEKKKWLENSPDPDLILDLNRYV